MLAQTFPPLPRLPPEKIRVGQSPSLPLRLLVSLVSLADQTRLTDAGLGCNCDH